MSNPGFWDCVYTRNGSFGNFLDSYFECFGNAKYQCIENNSDIVRRMADQRSECNCLNTVLKIILFPLSPFILIGKAINRRALHNYTIQVIDPNRIHHDAAQRANAAGHVALPAQVGPQGASQSAISPLAAPVQSLKFDDPQKAVTYIINQLNWREPEGSIKKLYEDLTDPYKEKVYTGIENIDQLRNILRFLPYNKKFIAQLLKLKPFDDSWKGFISELITYHAKSYREKGEGYLFDFILSVKGPLANEKNKFNHICRSAPLESLLGITGCSSAAILSERLIEGTLNLKIFYDIFSKQQHDNSWGMDEYLEGASVQFIKILATLLSETKFFAQRRVYQNYIHKIISTNDPDRDEKILAMLRGNEIHHKKAGITYIKPLDNLIKCVLFRKEFEKMSKVDQDRLKGVMTPQELKIFEIPFDVNDPIKVGDEVVKFQTSYDKLPLEYLGSMDHIWLLQLVNNLAEYPKGDKLIAILTNLSSNENNLLLFGVRLSKLLKANKRENKKGIENLEPIFDKLNEIYPGFTDFLVCAASEREKLPQEIVEEYLSMKREAYLKNREDKIN